MNKKKELGQFFTKNTEYIIDDLYEIIPCEYSIVVVDPFAGEEDLLKYIKQHRSNVQIVAYDIDPKTPDSICRDSLLNPLNLRKGWVITNPPYLAKNKTKVREPFLLYDVDDLYKCALKMISGYCGNSPCDGGILIIPLNFFSDRDDSLRRWFLSKYKVDCLRIFQERVFEDTDYTVCAFSFFRQENTSQRIKSVKFLPHKEGEGKENGFRLLKEDGYRIGGRFFRLAQRHKDKKDRIRIERLVKNREVPADYAITRLYLRAIDTGTDDGRVCLQINPNPLYAKESDRTFATIVSSSPLTWVDEEEIAKEFNRILEGYRAKYNSLMLTNYRNSSASYARKRIDFTTAFNLIEYIMYEMGLRKK